MRRFTPYALWLFVFWFALLQAMAPLLHGHWAGDNAADHGPHLHLADWPVAANTTSSVAEEDNDTGVDVAQTPPVFHWHVHAQSSHHHPILQPAPAICSSTQHHFESATDQAFGQSALVILLLTMLMLMLVLPPDSQARHFKPHRRHFSPPTQAPPCD